MGISSLRSKIRQHFCEHDFRASRFQSLTPGMDVECTKCGKKDTDYFWIQNSITARKKTEICIDCGGGVNRPGPIFGRSCNCRDDVSG